ncbi:hypothetical protein AN958_11558 [Leucoagaricus sp. SymC.cos]|nr:hypothetical protein AN958_11558 [Leucoagaricus sp. SymC.cos]
MLVYTTVLIICGCLYFASAVRIVQDGYVTFRNFPGGPYAYTVFAFSTPDNYLGLVIYFLVNWMTDALLIWRVYVLFGGKRYPWAVILFPCVIYFASVAMGLVVIVEDSHTTESFWSALAIPFVLAYYVLTTSLTIICTILLTYRLLKARERYIQAMGHSSHANQYLSIATMLIESSALYAIWSIIFLVLYAIGHPMQNVFLATQTDISIIALYLIIYRVSQGKAWSANTEETLSTMDIRGAETTRGTDLYIKPSFKRSGIRSGSTIRYEDAVTVETLTVDDSKKTMVMEA